MKKIVALMMMGVLLIGASAHVSAATTLTKDLKIGASDSLVAGEVSILQSLLKRAGYLKADITGYFGSLTQAAVKQYQAANSIMPISGFVGQITRSRLNSAQVIGAFATSTGVSMSLVSSSVYADNRNQDPYQGTFDMVVDVSAYDKDIFIPLRSTRLTSATSTSRLMAGGAVFTIAGSQPASLQKGKYAATVESMQGGTLVGENLMIEGGDNAQIRLRVVFDPDNSGVATTSVWAYSLKLDNINYGFSTSTTASNVNGTIIADDRYITQPLIIFDQVYPPTTPIGTGSIPQSVSVASTSLSLAYDSDKQESLLSGRAVYTIQAGNEDVLLMPDTMLRLQRIAGDPIDAKNGLVPNGSQYSLTPISNLILEKVVLGDGIVVNAYRIKAKTSERVIAALGMDTTKMYKGVYTIAPFGVRYLINGEIKTFNLSGINSNSVAIAGEKIEKDVITVISPNGGERVKDGDTVFIKWSSTLPSTARFNISQYVGNLGLGKVIAENVGISNLGYRWKVRALDPFFLNESSSPRVITPDGTYKIVVSCILGRGACPQNKNFDESDTTFTIDSKIPSLTINTPTEWNKAQSKIVTWSSQNISKGALLTFTLRNVDTGTTKLVASKVVNDGSATILPRSPHNISSLPSGNYVLTISLNTNKAIQTTSQPFQLK